MAQQIEVPGMGVVEFPDGMTDDQIAGAIKRTTAFNSSRTPLGAPEELTALERFAAKFPDWMAGPSGGVRGSAVGRLAMGAADPGVALVQLGANAIGQGDAVNRRVAEVEKQYQDARGAAGSEGFDPLRMVGSTAITAPVGLAGKAATTLGGMALKGAAQGAVSGALQPVVGGDFWEEKGGQVGLGAAGGAVAAPLVGALARVVSPRASVNAELDMLKREGVNPTIGQAAGGFLNQLEQKATSLPLVGDAIRSARGRAVEQFNEAAINRTVKPIGGSVKGSGQDAVAQAGDMISDAYENAIKRVKGVAFDSPEFNREFGTLRQMATNLEPAHAARFEKTLNDVVLGRMSPIGNMLGQTYKRVDSELGALAAKYGKSPMAGEQELSDAVKELQRIIRAQAARDNPDFAAAMKAADTAWAQLVRVEGAATRAANSGGVFTPGQLNAAARSADRSVRRRATARGDALMQDFADAGQSVLGNTVPDSGTAGRLMSGVGALGAGMVHPAIPAALGVGAAAYSPIVQNALVAMLRNRPEAAPQIANALRMYGAGPASVAAGAYSGGLSR